MDWWTKMDSCWENCDWWIAISRWFPCRWIRASRLCHWDSVGRIYCGLLYPPLSLWNSNLNQPWQGL